MKVVGLVSGGKDSCYNLIQCVKKGHEIVALLNLYPPTDSDVDEMDSYMFQTVGHQAIEYYSRAMDLPLFRWQITGKPLNQDLNYEGSVGDEVEDLFLALKDLQSKVYFDAISVGAIKSNYQRIRAENVCQRLKIQMLSYLWDRDQQELLKEMIDEGVEAILIKVAAIGLDPERHLGKTLDQMFSTLVELNQKYDIQICGEGGEYETLTLDCSLFKNKLIIEKSEMVIHSKDAFAPVGYLRPLVIKLVSKS